MASTSEQGATNHGVLILPPGSEQFPAPRCSDPPAVCSQCGTEMMFNPAYLADGGTWTCNCAAGWAQQMQQLKWFAVMIIVFLLIAGIAV